MTTLIKNEPLCFQGGSFVLYGNFSRRGRWEKEAVKEVEQYFARKLLLKLHADTKEAIVVSKAKASEFLQWMENR